MNRAWVRAGVVGAVLLWTGVAWAVASVLGAGADALSALAEYLSLSPALLQWFDALLGVLAGFGKGLVFLVWLLVTLLLLLFGGVAQGVAPILRAAWQMRKRAAPATAPQDGGPSTGVTYDVTPDRVRHD